MKYSYKTKSRLGALLVLLLASINLLNGQTKKILLLGMDGCRQDALMAANTPNIKGLFNHAIYSLDGLTLFPTISGNGWSTMLTGVTSTKHRELDNNFTNPNYANHPNFLKRMEDYNAALNTVSVVHWEPINTYINNNVDEVKTETSDLDVKNEVVNTLTNENPDVVFVQFDDIDEAGHSYGFSPDDPNYIQAIETTDGYIGDILTALRNRPNYANEDWLIILSPDHGGTGFSHGGNTYVERNIFSIYYNKNFTPQQIQVPHSKPDTVITKSDTSLVHYFANKVNAYDTTHAIDSYFGTSDFTIEFRVRTTSSSGDPAIISNKDWASGSNQGFIISNQSGKLQLNLGDGAGHRTDRSGPAIADGAWHNVAMVVDRTNSILQLYVDGSFASSSAISSSLGSLTSAYPFTVGQDGTGHYTYNFDGNIANLSVWSKALSATSISNHSNASEDITSGDADYSSLIGYWKGDDGSGNQLADSGPLENAMLFNTVPVWTGEDTVITAGQVIADTITGSFVNFNNNYATINDPLYNFGTTSFTLECKVKTTSSTGDPAIIANKDWAHGTNAGFIISNNYGSVKVNIGDGTNRADISGNTIADGNWHDIAMLVDREDSTLTLYSDGLCQGQVSIPASFGSLSTGYPLNVGQDGTGVYGYSINGNIADIRIWNKVIRPVDILNKFYAPLTGAEDGLTGYWKANEGSGNTFVDASSNGKNMSVNSAPTWEASTTPLINVAGNGHTIVPRMEDYAFSALTWMGVPIDPAWNLDGHSWVPTGAGATPVDLIKFNANYINNKVQLEWKSATEVNLNKYDIERSVDGITFTKIATVKATGAGSYSYIDATFPQGNFYYRLAEINNDGTFKYSNIVSINLSANTPDFKLYPNPASNYIKIQMNSSINKIAKVQVTDVAGKVRLNQNVQIEGGMGSLNILQLSDGIYFVSAICEGKHYTQKISVTK